jgi:glycosyltransferase involved in cell wall biosynthesis
MIKFSLITVCYNSANTIADTIESVRVQTYNNYEYIIIDGASVDGTSDVVNRYVDSIDYFVSEPDDGLYDAINKGIAVATGDVIGILNSDDLYSSPFILETIASAFNADDSLQSVIGNISFINSGRFFTRYYSSKFWKPSYFKLGIMPPHPSFYCRREVFSKFGNYRTDFLIAADFELLIRLLYSRKITYKYLHLDMVSMKPGGISNRGVKSFLTISREMIKAARVNSLPTNYLFVSLRLFLKLTELRLSF